MSRTTYHWRWSSGIIDCGGYGVTNGDTFHLGMRNYDSAMPCPNGLPVVNRKPSEVPCLRERTEKARKFIEEHSREIRVREAAFIISIPQVEEDLKDIKLWLQQMFHHPSANG